MNKRITVLIAVLALILPAFAFARSDEDLLLTAAEKNSFQKTVGFSVPSAAKHVDVDNINGYVHVTAYDGSTVQVSVNQVIKAMTKEDIEIAKKEVELKISEKNNTVEVYADGPFRSHDRSVRNNLRHDRYRVTYNLDIKVPRETALYLRTVNGGDVQVDGTQGNYDIKNINGPIELTNVAGSGRVYALNGGVKVSFARNPSENSYFGTLNGNVDVVFRSGLSADLKFKTFNGNAYTGFPVTALATPTADVKRRDGKFVYKSNRYSGARVGSGGPELQFDSFNGNIRLTEQ